MCLGLVFVIQYFMPFLVSNHLLWEERAGCFTLIVFMLSLNCQCSMFFLHSTVGKYTVCDFGIF